MPRKRRPSSIRGDVREVSPEVPTRQSEDEILDNMGAERDEESGELRVPEEKVIEAGAIDTASIQENQRMVDMLDKKRGGVKNVSFNVGDLLTQYNTLIQYWPPNSLDISVRRLTGTPVQHLVTSRPRSGKELYEAIRAVHGEYEEAEYEVKFWDNHRKMFRGSGRIVMPDSRDSRAQQGTPAMNYYPPGYPGVFPAASIPVAPGVAPVAASVAIPVATPAPVPAQAPPAGFDLNAFMAMQQQTFQMLRDMQAGGQAPPAMPPPPPAAPGFDLNALLASQRQLVEMIQAMQTQQKTVAPPGSAPAHSEVPPMQPPPGTLWVPGFGYVPVDRLMRAIHSEPELPERPERPVYRSRFEDPRFAGPVEPGPRFGGPRFGPQQPPPAPKTAAEQFREALSVVRTAVDAAREINEILPGTAGAASEERFAAAEKEEDDSSPVKIVDTGYGKFVYGAEDKSFRLWETGFANLGKILTWAGEQREAFQKAQKTQSAPAPERQLPPGYVEVGPGYQPPPGYVAVPVPESTQQQLQFQQPQPPQQASLPPPPAHMPPPMNWGMPPTFEGR